MPGVLKVIILVCIIGGYWWIRYDEAPTTPAIVENTPTLADLPSTTVITGKLNVPWAIAFLPDKRMLVTEREGRVRIVDNGGNLVMAPAASLPVKSQRGGEGGLMGITLHPEFSDNNFVYLYYTYSDWENQTQNKVVRMVLNGNNLTDEEVIVDEIPGGIYHNGGRLKFGPDGYLYITTGDAGNSPIAQDTESLGGKVLKVSEGGEMAPGNPFGNLVYSYGHRNPQGIAWDDKGNLWTTEHGRSNPSGFDELNLIKSGQNYGWEIIQGNETKDGMETPKLNSGTSTTWAPAGAAFVGNSLYFAGLKSETLYEAVIQNDRVVVLQEHLQGEYGRLREVIVGPDDMLYITTSNNDGRGNPKPDDDKIIRVDPSKL